MAAAKIKLTAVALLVAGMVGGISLSPAAASSPRAPQRASASTSSDDDSAITDTLQPCKRTVKPTSDVITTIPGSDTKAKVITYTTQTVSKESLGSVAFERIPLPDWNILTAIETDLAYFGVDPRPASGDALTAWLKLWSNATFDVTPFCDSNLGDGLTEG
jgi:hypothetical protein